MSAHRSLLGGKAVYSTFTCQSQRRSIRDIERARLEREVPLDGHGAGRAGRAWGKKMPPLVMVVAPTVPVPGSMASRAHGHCRTGDRPVDHQGAGIDKCRAIIGVHSGDTVVPAPLC